METQKIVNLVNSSENEYSKFTTKRLYVIDSEPKGIYTHENPIKFLTRSLESSLCDYFDAYVLVTGNITVTRIIAAAGDDPVKNKQPLAAATQVAFKNYAPFKDCRTGINDTFVDYVDFINIVMPMYNLIRYSDNYSDSSGSLWGFKRDEVVNNAGATNDDSFPSFKYKANLIANTTADGTKKGVKIAVPLKYLSNFWRSLEMPLINCKVEFSLNWIENYVSTTAEMGANTNATGADGATFKITDAKRYVPVVMWSAENNVKLVKQLNEGFKRPVYWNKYKVIDNKVVEIDAANKEKHIREWFDLSYQGVKRLFVPAYDNTEGNNQVSVNSFKKYFLPRVKIENYNIKIDGKNFYDQPINDLIKRYDEVRQVSTGQVMITRLVVRWILLILKKRYRLIVADLSKQKALHDDSRAIQQMIFTVQKINSNKYNSNNLLHSGTIKRNNPTIL